MIRVQKAHCLGIKVGFNGLSLDDQEDENENKNETEKLEEQGLDQFLEEDQEADA